MPKDNEIKLQLNAMPEAFEHYVHKEALVFFGLQRQHFPPKQCIAVCEAFKDKFSDIIIENIIVFPAMNNNFDRGQNKTVCKGLN